MTLTLHRAGRNRAWMCPILLMGFAARHRYSPPRRHQIPRCTLQQIRIDAGLAGIVDLRDSLMDATDRRALRPVLHVPRTIRYWAEAVLLLGIRGGNGWDPSVIEMNRCYERGIARGLQFLGHLVENSRKWVKSPKTSGPDVSLVGVINF
jgi:hypothetical protein